MKSTFVSLFVAAMVVLLSACDAVRGPSSEVGGVVARSDVDTEASVQNDGRIEYGDRFPKVVDVEAELIEGERWRFNVTLSSSYDSPARYADAWRVLNNEDKALGVRILTHDHANEQPFTRSDVITVPSGIDKVFVEGRDKENGWSGQRFEFSLEE